MKRTLDLGLIFERHGHQVPAGELVITVWDSRKEALRYGDDEEFAEQLRRLEAFLERVTAPRSHRLSNASPMQEEIAQKTPGAGGQT